MEKLNSEDTIETFEEDGELPEIKYNKNSKITFAKLNKYFIIPFLCPIFCFLTHYFYALCQEIKIIERTELFDSIFTDISYIIAGLFYFISYFRINYNKKNESSSNIENNNSGVIYIYNESIIDNYNPSKIIMLIILLSLIIGIYDFLSIFFDDDNNVF